MMPPTKQNRARTPLATGLQHGPDRIDREGRVIKGYSVATRGEAKGWSMWLDGEFLDQVVTAGNAAINRRTICRFKGGRRNESLHTTMAIVAHTGGVIGPRES